MFIQPVFENSSEMTVEIQPITNPESFQSFHQWHLRILKGLNERWLKNFRI
jgi:hypothetical protein